MVWRTERQSIRPNPFKFTPNGTSHKNDIRMKKPVCNNCGATENFYFICSRAQDDWYECMDWGNDQVTVKKIKNE